MSKIEVDKIDPQSGTDLELGTSGDTITIPAGVTFDSSAATNTLPSTVVTTTGTQTLTNKTIDASQLTGTITPSDSTVSLAKLTATGTKDSTTFLRGDNTFAAAGLNGWSEDGANNNLLPASASAGIYLGVTSATAANLLDDYEEGTFTPTFTGSSSNPSINYTNQDGDYVKIGNVVHFQIYFRCDETSAGSGNLRISGLPFTSANGSTYGGMQVSFLLNWNGSGGPETGQIGGNSTDIQMHRFGTNTSTVPTVDIGTSTFLRATGQYIAS